MSNCKSIGIYRGQKVIFKSNTTGGGARGEGGSAVYPISYIECSLEAPCSIDSHRYLSK